MLRICVLDFGGNWDELLLLMEFSYNNSYHASIGMVPYEALCGRSCKSPIYLEEVGERRLIGLELVEKTTTKVTIIEKNLQTTQCKQKNYADNRRRDLRFETGDHVFLKMSPMKGLLRFEKKEKLGPRFIGPFEVLTRVGVAAYRLALPPEYSSIHNVFHVSMLRRYHPDLSHIIQHETLSL